MINLTMENGQEYLDGVVNVSTSSKLVILFVSTLIILVGVPGNILVIWTYLSVKRLKFLQNAFIINLSVCDTIIIGYLLPLNMVALITGKCPLTGIFCLINGGIAHVSFTASVQTIMQIALVRYVKICCQDNRLRDFYTLLNVTIILIISWGMGVVFLIPLYLMDNSIIFDNTLHMCIFNRFNNATYTTIYQVLCLAVPITVTATCYISIYRKIVTSRRHLSRHWNNGLARKKHLYEMAVTKSQFAVFVVYMILYIPFGITAIFLKDTRDVPSSLHAAGIYLCFINSCINGIIYGLLNSNIRRAYKEALSCIFRQTSVQNDSSLAEDKTNNVQDVSQGVSQSRNTQETTKV